MYTHTHHTRTHTHTDTIICTHLTHTHTHTHTDTHIRTHTHIHTYTHTHTHIQDTYTYTQTHAPTHSYTPKHTKNHILFTLICVCTSKSHKIRHVLQIEQVQLSISKIIIPHPVGTRKGSIPHVQSSAESYTSRYIVINLSVHHWRVVCGKRPVTVSKRSVPLKKSRTQRSKEVHRDFQVTVQIEF